MFVSYDCKKESTAITISENDTTPLKDVAPFKVGASVVVPLLQNDSAYRKTVLQQYSSITPANTLKWYVVRPSENVFDFSGGDYVADFCAATGKRMHGHCLIWYLGNPDWLNHFTGDSAAWENLFKTHIQTVVGHYKGRATSWDVVNEAFNDIDGSLRVNDIDPSNNYDDGSIWARHLGRDYVARAFMYAHEADPSALLFYNDYGEEFNDRKADSILAMINNFKARGIPINGLGIQMHTNIIASEDGIKKAFQEIAATGLLIHVSELDVGVNPSNNPSAMLTDALEQKQADMFAFIVQQYKRLIPTNQQYGITTWDVGDADSWLVTELKRKDWPLLFDSNYIRKKAYFSFRNALVN
jgi:endo-1,4-beta-xylanase